MINVNSKTAINESKKFNVALIASHLSNNFAIIKCFLRTQHWTQNRHNQRFDRMLNDERSVASFITFEMYGMLFEPTAKMSPNIPDDNVSLVPTSKKILWSLNHCWRMNDGPWGDTSKWLGEIFKTIQFIIGLESKIYYLVYLSQFAKKNVCNILIQMLQEHSNEIKMV